MYENIGKQIKTVAKTLFWIGILICFVIAYFVIQLDKSNGYYWAIVIVAAGILLSWLANCLLYGFGELIDRTMSIDDKMNTVIHLLDKADDEAHK